MFRVPQNQDSINNDYKKIQQIATRVREKLKHCSFIKCAIV